MESGLKLSRRQSLKTVSLVAALPAAAPFASRLAGKSRSLEMPPVRLVVLDVGGTIIQDRGDVPTAMRTALARHGIDVTPAEISDWRGASKREMARHFVDLRNAAAAADREKLAASVYQDFSAQISDMYGSVPPIAGAEDAFRSMRRSGLLLATTTGFDRQLTLAIFQRLGWQQYFAAIVCSDDVTQGRPYPYMLFHAMESAGVSSVHETVAVGDTPLDLQAAVNGGLRGAIGVLSGASKPERLQRERHTHILPSVAELPALLRSAF
jgi:phosphonatase-like hydrolase